MNDLITVIVPVYNRFNVVTRSILSVLNQSYKNWEIIIIDDCSQQVFKLSDDFSNIEQNVILLRNLENLGPGLSRQKGLDLAQGAFVSFLDSDDFWYPDFLLESSAVLIRNTNICASYCQSEMTDGQLRHRNSIEEAVDNIFYGVVSGARPWATCSILWRRKYLSNWTKLRTNQDAMFELQTSLNNSKIEFIPKVLCVIDKGTGENANDLVGRKVGNINRTLVLLKAVKFLKNYKFENKEYIQSCLWLSLSHQSKKMLRQNNFCLFIIVTFTLIIKLKWILRLKSTVK